MAALAGVILAALIASPTSAFAEAWMSQYPWGTIHTQPVVLTVDLFHESPLNSQSVVLTLDGVPQRASVSQGPARGHWAASEAMVNGVWRITWSWSLDTGGSSKATVYCFPQQLADGTHVVAVTARDTQAIPQTLQHSWSFDVEVPPAFGRPTPAPGATVTTVRPSVSVPVSDNGAVSVVSARVNGVPATAAYANGRITVSGFTLTGGAATLAVTASDGANPATLTWSITVSLLEGGCRTVACHGTAYDSDPAMGKECGSCHAGALEPHTVGLSAAHAFADPGAACLQSGCHGGSTDLSALHATALTESPAGPRAACQVCHNDAVTLTKDCAACHPARVEPHGYLSATHAATLGSGVVGLFSHHEYRGAVSSLAACSDCHSSELGPTHAGICARCHPSPRDSFTGWTGSCSQAQCHPSYHGDTVAIHDAAAAGNCGVCHDETDFDLLPDPCFGCHEPYSAADTVAPITTSDARAAYSGAALVRFSVTDEGKIGIATTFYRIDGGAARTGDSVVVDAAGSHTLEFWSVDQNGNAEQPHKFASFTTTTDSLPPVTTSNARAAYEGPVSITLQATDASEMGVKGTYYRLNGGPVVAGTSISIAPSASGTLAYTLSFWSEDYSGNVEAPKTVTFTVTRDVTPPVTTCNVANGAAYIGAVTATLSASDGSGTGVAGTWYRLDAGAWTRGTSVVVPMPSSGTVGHTLSWYSRDVAANQEATKSVSFTVSAGASPSAPAVTPMPDVSFDYDNDPPPTLTMHWSPVTAPDGDPCTYRIEMISQYPYSGPLNWASAAVINVSGTSYTTQFWGGFYYWRVSAIDSVHTGLVSSPSAIDTFTVFDGYGPYY